eukprot:CAMPEP_0170478946 /NCGR_PEP_ID=MMETSP0208-20121228/351_1 /TAXON_ID=197538 /ORGANISM="Strombidium inclinatum, Strain S3" /LENGTH=118 /DNA_ID=CAMNT_0010751279 /DNA_START=472 /DNA_END=828 /DNA_ORIENTATION=-
MCKPNIVRKTPMNFIMMAFVVGFQAYLVGYICAFYNQEAVVNAMASSILIFVALTVYAWYAPELSLWIAFFVELACVVVIVLILFTQGYETLYLGLVGLMILIMGVYIVWDTQMIMKG